jgi:hypothetical protein
MGVKLIRRKTITRAGFDEVLKGQRELERNHAALVHQHNLDRDSDLATLERYRGRQSKKRHRGAQRGARLRYRASRWSDTSSGLGRPGRGGYRASQH